MSSKFTEMLDDSFRTTSPDCDVRLEDIVGAANFEKYNAGRGRTSSEASTGSNSSSENLSYPTSNDSPKKTRRMSRILNLGRR